jgi:PEP-CTERM motif-containing protein
MKKYLSKLIVSAVLLIASSGASATSMLEITGQIDFTGAAVITLSGNSISIIDFDTPTVNAPATTGVFISAIGMPVTFVDPFNVATPTLSLWSVAGFSFDLLNITANQTVDFDLDGTADYAFINGTGTISAPGYHPTSGQWSFSTQNFGGFSGGTFSFSSTTIPEPATLALLGLGLVGFAAARRKKQA